VLNPLSGDLMPNSGGLRKLRAAIPGRGKRGGARVIYLYIVVRTEIYLLHIYKKSVSENISTDQLKSLRELAIQLKQGD